MSTQSDSLAVRHPVIVPIVLGVVILGPMAVMGLAQGVPWPAIAVVMVMSAAVGGYVAYRTVRHKDDPGPIVRFFERMASGG
jgi:uncharacterized membrane protein YdbT with pleckstrin-like domain